MAAADALAAAPPAASTDSALAAAIEDDSPHVRAHVLLALGAHRSKAQLDKIRERFADEDEYPMVRSAAVSALASLCDTKSLPELTSYAHKLADPMADPGAHMIGASALLALGELRPADLESRLKPLTAKGAPSQARQAADAVLQRKAGSCGGAVSPKPAVKSRIPAS
jgi:HEAT repeat protein